MCHCAAREFVQRDDHRGSRSHRWQGLLWTYPSCQAILTYEQVTQSDQMGGLEVDMLVLIRRQPLLPTVPLLQT